MMITIITKRLLHVVFDLISSVKIYKILKKNFLKTRRWEGALRKIFRLLS
jgi:uncharacterized membrane protein YagU involved in acid resistance